MRKQLKYYYLILLIVLASLTACGSHKETSAGLKPHVVITAPRNESRVAIGESVIIEYTAADVKGIAYLDMLLNGQPLPRQKVEPMVTSYVATYVWMPEHSGEYLFQLRAFNSDNNSSDSVQITLVVTENEATKAAAMVESSPPLSNSVAMVAVEQPEKNSTVMLVSTPTIQPPPDKTSTVKLISTPIGQSRPFETSTVMLVSTPISMAISSVVAPAEKKIEKGVPTGGMATVIFSAVFVRSGPARNAQVLGKMQHGETAQITGRDRWGGWWQIVYPVNSNERGWIAAGDPFTTAKDAHNVPVVEH